MYRNLFGVAAAVTVGLGIVGVRTLSNGAALVAAQSVSSPTTLMVSAEPSLKNIPRIGVNLGTWTTYGAEQYPSNIVMNPGFEPMTDRAIVIVKASNSSGFADDAAWLARADGFWNKGTFQVLTGNSAGKAGTIVSSLAKGADGLPWFATEGAPPALKSGDAISVTRAQTSGAPAGWWIPPTSSLFVAIDFNDRRPHSPGVSSVALKLQNSQSTEIDYYWDSVTNTIPGQRFLPVNGRWRFSFWARGLAGASLAVSFERLNGSHEWLNKTLPLADNWQKYTQVFSATDDGPAGPLALKLSASGHDGNIVHLDDLQLESEHGATGAWRTELVETLKSLRPGYLRDWEGQLSDTLANRIGVDMARGPSRFNPDPTNASSPYLYGLSEFLDLSKQIDAQPWIVVPTTFYDSELTGFGQFLADQQKKYNFHEIVLEWGNENWNSVFRGGSIQDPAVMAEAANRAFKLVREGAGPTLPIHFVVNGQFVNAWLSSTALNDTPDANAVDVAPYFFYSFNSGDSMASAIASLTNMADIGQLISQTRKMSPGQDKEVDVYELNLSTVEGNAPSSQRDPLVAGMISGSALANRLLAAMKAGVRRQNVFALAQYNVHTPGGETKLWGITRDLAAANHFRPTGLALRMINQAVAGDYYAVKVAGKDADKINAAAFSSDGKWSLAIASTSQNASQITIDLPKTGEPPSTILSLSAPSITSTNEIDEEVKIATAPLTSLSEITIPPYGFVALVQSDNHP